MKWGRKKAPQSTSASSTPCHRPNVTISWLRKLKGMSRVSPRPSFSPDKEALRGNLEAEKPRRKAMYVSSNMVEKRRMKEKEEFHVSLESFAVVKVSLNPQKDFRDSMMEMMKEIDCNHPDELEELLVCYLTLNCDAYRDLIVKVFRQVWFDINRACPFCD